MQRPQPPKPPLTGTGADIVEAVLAELARRLAHRTRAQLLDILDSSSGVPLATTAARVVDALLDGIGGVAFRRTLLEEVPSAWKLDVSRKVDAEMCERLATCSRGVTTCAAANTL